MENAHHYMEELLVQHVPQRTLRFADKLLLGSLSYINVKSGGFHAFSV